MSDNKKKNPWLSWVFIAIVFVGLIFYLLMSFLSKGKQNATQSIYDKYVSITTLWASQYKNAFTDLAERGNIIGNYVDDNDLEPVSPEVIAVAHAIVEDRKCYRIVLYDRSTAVADSGEILEKDPFEALLNDEEASKTKYYFLSDNALGQIGDLAVSVPIKSGRAYVFLFLSPETIAKNIYKSGYETLSFAVIFKKDGTVIRNIDRFMDSDSKFTRENNFLTNIQEGTTREEYNLFKAKLYNGSGCAIHTEYKGDERTIAVAPIGIEDWYIGFGVRQAETDVLVRSAYGEVKNTIMKLAVVLGIFVVGMVALAIIGTTRSREKGRKLEDKADMDLLTELTNKAATERMIAEYISDNKNGHGVLFILDIDNFKKVNDTMGHTFGDTLLKTLGKEIRKEFRVTDIVGRTGGDEFMIFLKDVSDELIVEREANRITRFFHDFKAGGDYVKYSATASIGVAIFPEDGATFKDLYVSADQALYRAKKRGKNQLVFYNEEKYGKQ